LANDTLSCLKCSVTPTLGVTNKNCIFYKHSFIFFRFFRIVSVKMNAKNKYTRRRMFIFHPGDILRKYIFISCTLKHNLLLLSDVNLVIFFFNREKLIDRLSKNSAIDF